MAGVVSEPIWALAVVLCVGIVAYVARGIVWMRFAAAEKLRAEQRDERDNGIVARLRIQVDATDAALVVMKREQATFLANARLRT